MPNFVDSNLEPAVARFVGGFTAGQERPALTEFLKVMIQASDYIFQDAESLRESEKREIKAKVLKQTTHTVTGARTCNLTGPYGDSVSQTLNWQTPVTTRQISMKQHQDNEFSFQEAFAKQLRDARKDLLADIETKVQAFFEASKTTINNASSYGTFDAGTNTFEITPDLATNPGFLNIIEQMMKENRWLDGMYQAIVNGYTWPQLRFQSQQGGGNNQNLAWQFTTGMFNITNGLGYQEANYPNWFSYVFPVNTVGMLIWTPLDYRQPRPDQSAADNIGTKQVIPDPEIPGLKWTLKTKLECEDTSSLNGGDDDEVLKIQVGTDFSNNYALTEDGSTPIFAVGSEEAPVA